MIQVVVARVRTGLRMGGERWNQNGVHALPGMR
jgi:hypothetical protein